MTTTINEDQIEIKAWERIGYRWSYGNVFQIRGMIEMSHQASGHNLQQTYWDTRCSDCNFELTISFWDFDTNRYSLNFSHEGSISHNLIIDSRS